MVYLLPMGLGKSKIILDIVSCLCAPTVVLVPNVVNIEGWREQIRLHAPHLRAVGLDQGTREQKEAEAFEGEADILLVTYAGLNSLLSDRVPSTRKGKGTTAGKTELTPNLERIAAFADHWDVLVCDESTSVMNRRSLTTRVCMALAERMPFRYCLTGTPFGRTPEALWSQFYIADLGYALGRTITLFRQAFFTQKRNYWGGYEYSFQTRLQPELRRMMAASSIHYRTEDCVDLPDRVGVQVPVLFPEPAEEVYRKIVVELRAAKNNPQFLENAFIRLRQIASGFTSYWGDEGRECVSLGVSPKEDALVEWLQELPVEEKVVVFHDFIYTGDQLSSRLQTEKIKHGRIYSGTRDKAAVLRAFLYDPQVRVLLLNNQSGAFGLNLQVARYIAFYESPVSPIIRAQAEKRCHRPGQDRTVFIYDFFVRHSIEEKILRYLREGRDLLQSVLGGQAEKIFDLPS